MKSLEIEVRDFEKGIVPLPPVDDPIASLPRIDTAAEKKLVRRLDLHIACLIMPVYLFSFLDRVNIGNARLFGLEEVSRMNS